MSLLTITITQCVIFGGEVCVCARHSSLSMESAVDWFYLFTQAAALMFLSVLSADEVSTIVLIISLFTGW